MRRNYFPWMTFTLPWVGAHFLGFLAIFTIEGSRVLKTNVDAAVFLAVVPGMIIILAQFALLSAHFDSLVNVVIQPKRWVLVAGAGWTAACSFRMWQSFNRNWDFFDVIEWPVWFGIISLVIWLELVRKRAAYHWLWLASTLACSVGLYVFFSLVVRPSLFTNDERAIVMMVFAAIYGLVTNLVLGRIYGYFTYN